MSVKRAVGHDAGVLPLSSLENLPPLILLSSKSKRHAQALAELAQGKSCLYYALPGAGSGLRDFLSGLIAQCREQEASFGQRTLEVLSGKHARQSDLVGSLISDLAAIEPRCDMLILDQLDWLVLDDETQAFFRTFAQQLPLKPRLVIHSRYLGHALWQPLVQQGRAVVLDDEQTPGGPIFDGAQEHKPHLEVYALSGGEVLIDGLPITSWEGPLVRNLFYFLLDHPLVTRDEIFDTFWPGMTVKEATNVFHVTKRKISERFGHELTEYKNGFYRPASDLAIHYDAHEVEQLVDEARLVEPEQATPLWTRAVGYYKTPFLSRLHMPWILARREQLQQFYVEALVGLGRFHEANGASALAISFFLRALREVPQREDLHRSTMELYAERGETKKAVVQYKALLDLLNRRWKIEPSRETQAVFARVSAARR